MAAVDDRLFPLDVLAVGVEAEADGVGGEACGCDGGLGGEDLGFVVARELRVRYHVSCGDLPAEFLVDGCGGGFAVGGTADVARGGFLEEEAVGAFVLEENNGGKDLRGKKGLELALCFGLDVGDHFGVGEGFEVGGDLEALIDGEDDPHAESGGALGCLDLDVKAAPVEFEEKFFGADGGVVDELGGPETLTALGFNTDGIDASVGKSFDGVFNGCTVIVVEGTAGDRFHAEEGANVSAGEELARDITRRCGV